MSLFSTLSSLTPAVTHTAGPSTAPTVAASGVARVTGEEDGSGNLGEGSECISGGCKPWPGCPVMPLPL